MEYSFQKHPLSEAEKLWIEEVARTEKFDTRVAKVRLLGRLPDDFDPSKIDSRIYVNGRLTLIGLWHVNPKHSIFYDLDKVVLAVRKRIIESPGIEVLTAEDIAADIGQSKERVGQLLDELGRTGSWYSGASGKDGRIETIHLSNDTSYDEYLRYKGVEDVLERFYAIRGPSKAKPWPMIMLGEEAFGTRSTSGRDYEQKPVKANTAFVLMAIDPERHELADVYSTIKRVSKTFGISAYRADEIQHQDRITDRILEEIETCEFLIADLSYERPNVYYEIGFAHAINKKPILYRRTGTRLHFDLSVHNVPEYRNATELEQLLAKRFEAILGRGAKQS